MIPFHGIVWIPSQASLAVVKEPSVLGRRIQCILISSVGLEFKNICSLTPSGIVDAAPMLREYDDNILHVPNSTYQMEGEITSLAIGVALLEAANKVIGKCEKNKRFFPWNVVCPDLFMRPHLVESVFPSPQDAYDETYKNFSTLLVERDTLGYMTEVSKADDFHRFPAKYVNATPPARCAVTSKAQNSLRTHVKNSDAALPGATRKFVQYGDNDDDGESPDEGRSSKVSRR